MNAQHCFMLKVLVFSLFCLKDGLTQSDADEKLGYNRGQRHKREVTVYEIEVLIVADYSVYSFWRDRAAGSTPPQKDANAKRNLKQYYVSLLHAADQRYSSVSGRGYEMKLLYAGLYIADTAARASWIENIKNDTVTPTSVDVVDAIISFKTWLNRSIASLPEHDHAIAFTTHPFTTTMQGYRGKSIIGIAYNGGLCSQNKHSLAKDSFDANTGTRVAGYIAFNLKVKVDGNGNNCLRNQGYVMEAVSDVTSNATKNQRLWMFSNCTLDYFDSFIRELNCQNMNCMISRSAAFNESAFDMYTSDLFGQIYTPDEQCDISDGQGSYMARQHLDIDYASICSKMACAFGNNQRSSRYRIPWEGTSCGNGKICIKGVCTVHELAPSGLTETCLFGDQPGLLASEQQTCYELLIKNALHYKCFQYEKQCCHSCGFIAKLHSHLTDCKYGDKFPNCDASQCQLYKEQYKNDTGANPCCLTCAQNTTLAAVMSTTPYLVSLGQETTTSVISEALNTFGQHRSTEGQTTLKRSMSYTTSFPIPKIHECPWTQRKVEITQKSSTATFLTNVAAESRSMTLSGTLGSQTFTDVIMTLNQADLINKDISQRTDTSLRTQVTTTFERKRSTSEARMRNRTTDPSLRSNIATTFEEQISASETRTRSQAIVDNTNTNQMTDNNRGTNIASTFEMQNASRNAHDIMDSTSATVSKYSGPLHTMVVTKYSKTFRTAKLIPALGYTPTTAKFLHQTSDVKQTSVVYSFNKVFFTRKQHKLKCSAASVCSWAATVWLIGLLTSLL